MVKGANGNRYLYKAERVPNPKDTASQWSFKLTLAFDASNRVITNNFR